MGWLILIIVIFIIALIVSIKTESASYEYEGLQSSCACLAFFSAVGILILAGCFFDTKSDAEATILKYENLKTISSDLGVTSETTLEEIISMNKKICNHKIYANRFMTKGLYSKKVGELPLLEVPEIMKVSPIDYE